MYLWEISDTNPEADRLYTVLVFYKGKVAGIDSRASKLIGPELCNRRVSWS